MTRPDRILQPARRHFLGRLGQGLGVGFAIPFLPVASSQASAAERVPACVGDDVKLPGRLGNPDATLATDGRVDPRILRVLEASGGLEPFPHGLTVTSTYEECLEWIGGMEASLLARNEQRQALMPKFPDLVSSTETIRGVDGNEIRLYIDQPGERPAKLPCIYHTHGGGMCFMTTQNPTFVRFRKTLAASGI